MSQTKKIGIDFAHASVVCPDLLLLLPPVRYVALPQGLSENETKAASYIIFKERLHEQFPNIDCVASANFLAWSRQERDYGAGYPADEDTGEGLTRAMAAYYASNNHAGLGLSLSTPLARLRFVCRYLEQFPHDSLPYWAWLALCSPRHEKGFLFPLPAHALGFLPDTYTLGDKLTHAQSCKALLDFLECNQDRLLTWDAPEALTYLLEPDPFWDSSEQNGISILLSALSSKIAPDLAAGSVPSSRVVETFLAYCIASLPAKLHPPAWQLLAWERQNTLPELEKTPSETYVQERQSSSISLMGWGDGTLGIGEDERTLKTAFDLAKIPCSAVNISPLVPHGASPHAWETPLQDKPDGLFSIICLAAQDIYRLWARTPAEWWTGRHTIGLCPWELPFWPKQGKAYLDMLDEIWAPSQFVASAFAGFEKPVTVLPHAIIPPRPEGDLRKELGISQNELVFLTAFDAGASCVRKNPLAVVRAFNVAFAGKKNYPVRLIVKSMYAERDMNYWNALHDENACDDAVIFINDVLTPERNARLLNTCDAFVSLHRSEGFGRLLAESMGMGKLLIASNFGGNTDFTLPETACPVNGRTIPLKAGEYLFSKDQHWFEPDIEHAAHCMRFCVEQREAANILSENGKAYIKSHHAPEVIGQMARVALQKSGWRG